VLGYCKVLVVGLLGRIIPSVSCMGISIQCILSPGRSMPSAVLGVDDHPALSLAWRPATTPGLVPPSIF
jgi:hypothetical protein